MSIILLASGVARVVVVTIACYAHGLAESAFVCVLAYKFCFRVEFFVAFAASGFWRKEVQQEHFSLCVCRWFYGLTARHEAHRPPEVHS